MDFIGKFLKSSIGLKILMALTGLAMVGFVFGHMVGNLQLFLGQEALDKYGSFLQGLGELLWLIRIGLFSALAVHVTAGLILTLRSWAARPVSYKLKRWNETSLASRTMVYGGIAVGLFLVVHLLHLTVGVLPAMHAGDFHHCEELMVQGVGMGLECSVYSNVISGFSLWWVDLIYVVGMVFLGLHLAHGAWSLTRTLGLENPRYDAVIQPLAVGLGVLIGVVNSLIPLSVLFGIVQ